MSVFNHIMSQIKKIAIVIEFQIPREILNFKDNG